jgi:hypothetical protein
VRTTEIVKDAHTNAMEAGALAGRAIQQLRYKRRLLVTR